MNVKLFLLPVLFTFGIFTTLSSFTNVLLRLAVMSGILGNSTRTNQDLNKSATKLISAKKITNISKSEVVANISETGADVILNRNPNWTMESSESTTTNTATVATSIATDLLPTVIESTMPNLANSTELADINSSAKLMTLEWIGFDHGLGNFMFQYASLLGLANKFGRVAVLKSPPPDQLSNVFNLTVQKFPDNLTWHQIPHDCIVCNDTQRYNVTQDYISIGYYLQYFGVFHNIKDQIRSEFKFQPDTVNQAQARKKLIKQEYCKTPTCLIVGVHVRRGDFLYQHIQNFGSLPANDTYFDKAVSWFKTHFSQNELVFAVLGNPADSDIQYNRQRFALIDATSVILIPRTADLDMCFLSICDHLIMTVGTFRWWSGYLGSGNVTYSSTNVRPASQLASLVKAQFYPDEWIKL